MSFRTTEHCDICGKEVGWSDREGGYNWSAIRLCVYDADYQYRFVEMPGLGEVPSHTPTSIAVRERRARWGEGSCSSVPMPGLNIPGVVCSIDCLEKPLVAWIASMRLARREQKE